MDTFYAIITHLNWIDWVEIVFIGLFALLGLKKGFVTSIVSLLVWVFSTIVAYYLAQRLSHTWELFSDSLTVRFWIYFIVLLIGCWVVTKLVLWILAKFHDDTESKSMPDKLLGFVFGLAKGVLIGSIIVWGINSIPVVEQSRTWQRSQLTPVLLEVTSWIKQRGDQQIIEDLNNKI